MKQTSMQLTFAALMAALVAPCAGASMLRKVSEVPKKDATIPNPMSKSIGDVVPPADPPPPKGQQYDHLYAPLAPAYAPDHSPTDPSERLDSIQGTIANWLDPMASEEGQRFEGSTCQSVCAACTIYAANIDSGQCFCYASCKMGECKGVDPHIGWSNNEVTTPRSMWRASCNVGEKNCEAQCMTNEFKEEVAKCEDNTSDPAACWNRLRSMSHPTHLDARKDVHYCTKKGMSTCDTFLSSPQEGAWMCYHEQDKCKQRVAEGSKIPMETWDAPHVWSPMVVGPDGRTNN